MGISAELAKNIARTPFEVFDRRTVEKAKNRIMDAAGCAVAGTKASGCSMLLDLLREWGGAEQSTILGIGAKFPVHCAAMMNAVLCRSYDFEPTGALVQGKSTPAHITGTTVPAALAVGEMAGASGKDILTALILGDDVASRVAAASQLNIDSGWDSTGTVNAFGTVAIAGRLMGLTEGQIVNALGIALNQLGGTFLNIFDYTHTFKLPQGLAAQNGIFAAALAKKGFTAAKEPLTGKNGYFSLYCKNSRVEILEEDLGKIFCAGDTFKPYPCCRSNQAAVECTLMLASAHDLKPEDVKEMVVTITPTAKDFAVGQPFRIGDVPQINGAFSIEYTVAAALLRRGLRLEHFTDDAVRDPSIPNIIRKIRLDPSLPKEKPLGAIVRIVTVAGDQYQAGVDMPKGSDTLTPLSQDEKREKFLNNVAWSGTVPADKAKEALELFERLEEVDNIRKVIELLVP
jgi:2-methylcitrate dehydratase PrpD